MDGAPKNSMQALEQAAVRGAKIVEHDSRQLADGTIVIRHDPAPPKATLNWLGNPPTLEQWARRAGELEVGVLAEVKEAGYEAELVDTLRRYISADRLALFSFEEPVVARLSKLAPDLPVGLLSDLDRHVPQRPQELIADARRVGASFLGLNVRQATEPMLAAAHEAGLGVTVWTVDDADDLQRLLADPRVARVITDVPRTAIDVRRGLGGIVDSAAGIRRLPTPATMH